ncbi:MAG: nitrous oxide reductase family maturation protein NosD [Candidatus Dormibacteria bacterium]
MGRFTRLVALMPIAMGTAFAFAAMPATSVAAAENHETLFVSPTGASGHEGESCGTARYSTIGAAVAAADSEDTIHVCKGTYAEMVVITKELRVLGFDATVDAANHINGFRIGNFPLGPWGAGSETVLRGFTVKNALGEGILAVRVTEVRIEKNVVAHNDMGTTVSNTYLECQAQGQIPGDCGEGLHLMSATHSTVWHNDVEHNAGGVLMTDEFGPANGNVISHNVVSNNAPDCGITIPSHNTNSFANGKPQPTIGGVFNNLITGNLVEHNGEGGVLFGGAGPGAAVYNNEVTGNTIRNNGFAAVTLHDHTPGQDFNGNEIEDNWIGTSNVTGDPDFGLFLTTGIEIASVADQIHIVIEDNHIEDNHFGIWTKNVPKNSFSDNTFDDVTVKVKQT